MTNLADEAHENNNKSSSQSLWVAGQKRPRSSSYRTIETSAEAAIALVTRKSTSKALLLDLMGVAYYGHTRVVEMLLENGCDMEGSHRYRVPPLVEAILNGHEEIAQLLLVNGCAINSVQGKTNKSALQLNVEKGYVSIVKMLLSAGANANFVDSNGYSLLDFAILHGLPEVWDPVIEKSDLSRVDATGRTLLQASLIIVNFAIPLADLTFIPKLLEHGSDVNVRCDKYQRQPLHLAACGEYVSNVQQLLDCGSGIDARDLRNRLSLYNAYDPAIRKLLLLEMGVKLCEFASAIQE